MSYLLFPLWISQQHLWTIVHSPRQEMWWRKRLPERSRWTKLWPVLSSWENFMWGQSQRKANMLWKWEEVWLCDWLPRWQWWDKLWYFYTKIIDSNSPSVCVCGRTYYNSKLKDYVWNGNMFCKARIYLEQLWMILLRMKLLPDVC